MKGAVTHDVLFSVCCLTAFVIGCEGCVFTVNMYDTWGDGWSTSSGDFAVNLTVGGVSLTPLSLPSGSFGSSFFRGSVGDEIVLSAAYSRGCGNCYYSESTIEIIVTSTGSVAYPKGAVTSGGAFTVTDATCIPIPDGSCDGNCDSINLGFDNCACDLSCQGRQDCCSDFSDMCSPPDCVFNMQMTDTSSGWEGTYVTVEVTGSNPSVVNATIGSDSCSTLFCTGAIAVGADIGDTVSFSQAQGGTLESASEASYVVTGPDGAPFFNGFPVHLFHPPMARTFTVGETCASTASQASCNGICGGVHPTGCSCENACQSLGTCCGDYVDVCTACTFRLLLSDSFGDTWNGCKMNLSMSDNNGLDPWGPEIIVSLTDTADAQHVFGANVGTMVNLSQGYDLSYAAETRFQVVAGDGTNVYTSTQSLSSFSGDLFFVTSTCGISEGSCVGNCGEFGFNCHCDASCQTRGDCCEDYINECLDCTYTVEMEAASSGGWSGTKLNVTINNASIPVSLVGFAGSVQFGASHGDLVALSTSFGPTLAQITTQSVFQLVSGDNYSLFNTAVPVKYFTGDSFVVSDTCNDDAQLSFQIPTCANSCGDFSETAKCQCDAQCQGRNDCCPDYVAECVECAFTVNLMDSFGDGWNGIKVDLSIAETLQQALGAGLQAVSLTLADGKIDTYTFGASIGNVVDFSAPYSGSWYVEASYNVTKENEIIVVPTVELNDDVGSLWQVTRDCRRLDVSNTCEGSCGENITADNRICFCDEACIGFEDCCVDYQVFCTAAPTNTPTKAPTTDALTQMPTELPTQAPTTNTPTQAPTTVVSTNTNPAGSSGSNDESSSNSMYFIIAGCAIAVAVVLIAVAVFRKKAESTNDSKRTEVAFDNPMYSSGVLQLGEASSDDPAYEPTYGVVDDDEPGGGYLQVASNTA